MSQVGFEDFYKVPELKFNIVRLREDLERGNSFWCNFYKSNTK